MSTSKKFLSLSLIGCLSLSVIIMGANAAHTDDSNNSAAPSAINSDISTEISVENDAILKENLSMLKLDTLSNEQYQSVMEAAPTAYKSLETAQSEQEKEEILAARKIIVYTQKWSREGFPRSGVYHRDTGEFTGYRYFHEIFPQDWEIPGAKISVENAATLQEKLSMLTLDKLSNEQYQVVMEAAPTAYKSLETAQSEQEKEEILAARKIIVYTQSWCRDGFPRTGIYHGDTGEITWTRYFHEIFPQDWEIPN